MSENSLTVLDFCLKQPTNYTYFRHALNTYTWIDHCVTMSQNVCKVASCHIVLLDDGNTSDHLPIRLQLNLPLSSSKVGVKSQNIKMLPIPKWYDKNKREKYKSILTEKLNSIPLIDPLSCNEEFQCYFCWVGYSSPCKDEQPGVCSHSVYAPA